MTTERDWMEELTPVDPPPELVSRVMADIKQRGSSKSTPMSGRIHPGRGGTGMAKKVLLGFVAVAAALIIMMLTTGYPPLDRGIEGTIGAAKRYRRRRSAKTM